MPLKASCLGAALCRVLARELMNALRADMSDPEQPGHLPGQHISKAQRVNVHGVDTTVVQLRVC